MGPFARGTPPGNCPVCPCVKKALMTTEINSNTIYKKLKVFITQV